MGLERLLRIGASECTLDRDIDGSEVNSVTNLWHAAVKHNGDVRGVAGLERERVAAPRLRPAFLQMIKGVTPTEYTAWLYRWPNRLSFGPSSGDHDPLLFFEETLGSAISV